MPGVKGEKKKLKSSKRTCHNCCCFVPKRRKVMEEQESLSAAKFNSASEIERSIQYEENLPKELKVGSVIAISGTIHYNCSRFAVNLLCKKYPNRTTEDIAFHFNPRLDRRYIARNCRLGTEWGDEETTSIQKFQFKRNEKFLLHIFVAEEKFLVSLNGKHICGFVFRVPLSKVTKLEIAGFVDIHDVEYKEIQEYPEPVPENAPSKIGLSIEEEEEEEEEDITSQELDIPFTGLLPATLRDGCELEIYGRVKILPHSFCINIQKGSQLWPHPTIILHLNVRFDNSDEAANKEKWWNFLKLRRKFCKIAQILMLNCSHCRQNSHQPIMPNNLLTLNHFEDGKWGVEHRIQTFHFSAGSKFKLVISRNNKYFKIWNLDTVIAEFPCRGLVEESNIVYIQGDVAINKICLKE